MGKMKAFVIDQEESSEPEDPNDGVLDPGMPPGYIMGLGRDVPHPRVAHMYKGTFGEPGLGMCRYAYNRKEEGYSIWRGNEGRDGVCQICWKRAMAGLDGIENPYYTEQMRKDDEELEKELNKPFTAEEQAEIDAILGPNENSS